MNKTFLKILTVPTLLAFVLPTFVFGFPLALLPAAPDIPAVLISTASDHIGVDDSTPVRNEVTNGLNATTFDTLVGTVTVNLPDDLAAGDTISGTVIAEPKKQDQPKDGVDDQTASDSISGYVVEVAKQETPMKKPDGNLIDFCKNPPANTNDRSLTVCKKWSIPDGVSKIPVTLKNKAGKVVGRAEIPVAKKPDPANAPVDVFTPPVGQAGKPLAVKGPFDGDFANTAVKVGDQAAKFLASSPRKVIVESPRDLKGPTDIQVEYKGKLVAKCTYRNVSVKLGADKLNLIKGETTSLSVTLAGLIGLLSPITLQLSNHSVNTLNMEGGNLQTLKVDPKEVNGDIYTTRRSLTGLSAGGFSITAILDPASVQGNLSKCTPAPRDLPGTPIPEPSQPIRPDPNPTATPVPAPQPTPEPTPQPAHGRFQVTLNGFKAWHVTNHGLFQRPDAITTQPEIISVRLSPTPFIGAGLHGGNNPTIGSSEYPVRGGSAPGGGFRNGDGFPDPEHPESRHGPLGPGVATTPPTLYYRNWEDELVQGENAAVIIPTIWSIDNNADLGLRERFLDTMAMPRTLATIREAVIGKITSPPRLDIRDYLVSGTAVGIPNTMTLAIGVPQNRPIGMQELGARFGYTPKVLVLTYESADFISRTSFGYGVGIVPVRYTDNARLGGDYEMYLQVERVDNCLADIVGARFTGSAVLTTTNRDAPGPYPGELNDLRVSFTECRGTMQVTNFPPLVNTSNTRIGPNTSTVTMDSGGGGTFNTTTRMIDLSITLGLVNSVGVLGNSTLPIRLTGTLDPTTGIATLSGTGRFQGGQLGTTFTDGTVTITGRFSPMP